MLNEEVNLAFFILGIRSYLPGSLMEVGEEKIITRNADSLHPIMCCMHYFAKLSELNIEVLLRSFILNEHKHFKKCVLTQLVGGVLVFILFCFSNIVPELSIL